MRKQESIIGHLDWPLFVVFMLLIVMGFSTVYSVLYNPEHPMIWDFSQKYGKQLVWIAVSLFNTAESIATPCSVNARGRYLIFVPLVVFKVTICDLRERKR